MDCHQIGIDFTSGFTPKKISICKGNDGLQQNVNEAIGDYLAQYADRLRALLQPGSERHFTDDSAQFYGQGLRVTLRDSCDSDGWLFDHIEIRNEDNEPLLVLSARYTQNASVWSIIEMALDSAIYTIKDQGA